MGTGSALLAREVARYAASVIAADIDKEQIEKLKKENKNKKIQFIYSDLFSNIKDKKKFDLIIFNPPYLPSQEIKIKEIDGGKNGTEIIERFLKQARYFLRLKGKILLICSSLNVNIKSLFREYKYSYKKLDQASFFFERIFLHELSAFGLGIIIKPSFYCQEQYRGD